MVRHALPKVRTRLRHLTVKWRTMSWNCSFIPSSQPTRSSSTVGLIDINICLAKVKGYKRKLTLQSPPMINHVEVECEYRLGETDLRLITGAMRAISGFHCNVHDGAEKEQTQDYMLSISFGAMGLTWGSVSNQFSPTERAISAFHRKVMESGRYLKREQCTSCRDVRVRLFLELEMLQS